MTDPAAAAQTRAEGGGASRDFDGGLLSRLSYRLTARDALAYLRLKRELAGWQKWALGLWFLFGGAVFGLLPEGLSGATDSWRYIAVFLAVLAVQAALWLAARELWRRYRARRIIPRPIAAEFEEWIDCVAGTDLFSHDCDYLSPELIGQIVSTKTHIFMLNFTTTIAVPKAAFPTAQEAEAMAAHLVELARGPYYFEA
jgi:hypothetical protein